MAKGYPPNRLLVDGEGKPYDILKGTFFICGLSTDDFASISDELAEKYTEKFYWPEVFARFGDHVIWLFVYIMHEDRELALPSPAYVRVCREGYKAFRFDEAVLDEALEYTMTNIDRR